jgi:hypothetical protein
MKSKKTLLDLNPHVIRIFKLYHFPGCMILPRYLLAGLSLLFIVDTCYSQRKYFFSNIETNKHLVQNGSRKHPFHELDMFATLQLKPGDTIFFRGGNSFNSSIVLDSVNGKPGKPIVFTSYGKGKARIYSGNKEALSIARSNHLSIISLIIVGAGRKNGNTTDGVKLSNCQSVKIRDLEITGFQKSGLLLFNCKDVEADRVIAMDNGLAGILVEGDYQKRLSQNIHIVNCRAENNPGDPTNLSNHSGNGILVGNCRNVLIEYCTATNNGWDMPRIGNGPVGIWAYEADSIIIQHCISYRNKTALGAADGGGFDLDGGVTNSVIQYCLSYENQGSGYGIFQYWSARNWKNNTLRYCISINDGKITEGASAMYIWNGNNPDSSFTNFYAHNNFFYNDAKYAFSFASESRHRNFHFYKNYFIASDTSEIYSGIDSSTTDVFLDNVWSRRSGGFFQDGFSDLGQWVKATGYEMRKGKQAGTTLDKKIFDFPAHINITDPYKLFNEPLLKPIWNRLKN